LFFYFFFFKSIFFIWLSIDELNFYVNIITCIMYYYIITYWFSKRIIDDFYLKKYPKSIKMFVYFSYVVLQSNLIEVRHILFYLQAMQKYFNIADENYSWNNNRIFIRLYEVKIKTWRIVWYNIVPQSCSTYLWTNLYE